MSSIIDLANFQAAPISLQGVQEGNINMLQARGAEGAGGGWGTAIHAAAAGVVASPLDRAPSCSWPLPAAECSHRQHRPARPGPAVLVSSPAAPLHRCAALQFGLQPLRCSPPTLFDDLAWPAAPHAAPMPCSVMLSLMRNFGLIGGTSRALSAMSAALAKLASGKARE